MHSLAPVVKKSIHALFNTGLATLDKGFNTLKLAILQKKIECLKLNQAGKEVFIKECEDLLDVLERTIQAMQYRIQAKIDELSGIDINNLPGAVYQMKLARNPASPT
jgi:hypothetical protein